MSDNDPFLNPHYREDTDAREASLRPQFLKDFQGQKDLKENLNVFITAAREREESLDHIFLSGPPGLGKTTLAGIMANEMGSEFKVTSAPALDKPKDLAGILTTITEGFTLIGATTKAGSVASPLYSRFGIAVRMDFYTNEDIESIINRSAGILDVSIEQPAVKLLAGSSRGTPRVANRLLRRMRDFAQVLGNGIIDAATVKDGLKRLKIDNFGLEKHDREILRTIIIQYQGGPVGAETLAISVGEAIESLEDFYEPYLIQRGFITRTPRGRMATELAYKHLNIDRGSIENQSVLF